MGSEMCIRDRDKAALLQVSESLGVKRQGLLLAGNGLLPRDAKRGQILELAGGGFGRGTLSVDVINAHPEPASGMLREQPREHCRA